MAAGVWVKDKPLMLALRRWITECPGGTKAHKNAHLRGYRKYILKDIGSRFRKGGVDKNDNTHVWPELSEKVAKYKFGKPMMYKTGALARSIKIKVKKSGREIYQTAGTKYYWYHHNGAEIPRKQLMSKKVGKMKIWTTIEYKVKLPQRQLLLYTRKNINKLDEALRKWFAKATSKVA